MASEQFDKLGERVFALNPHHRGNYESLMKEIRALDRVPARIVHLWGVTPDVATPSNFDWYTETQGRGFYSLIYLAQVLGEHGLTDEVQIEVVTNHMQEVTGDESLLPEKATVLGPCKVIPQEYANIKCRVVDISLPAPGSVDEERLAQNLIGEFAALPSEDVVAYRGRHRWLQIFEPLRARCCRRKAASARARSLSTDRLERYRPRSGALSCGSRARAPDSARRRSASRSKGA